MSDQRTRTRPANHDPRKRRIRSCTPDLRSRNRVRACHGLPFVGAARPHTPRLPPLPRRLTPEGKHPGTRTINDSQRTSGRLRGRTTGHGQRLTRRYSSQPGGSIFNAHLAQSSVSVSTCATRSRRRTICGSTSFPADSRGARGGWSPARPPRAGQGRSRES